jgi:hypothetical protein
MKSGQLFAVITARFLNVIILGAGGNELKKRSRGRSVPTISSGRMRIHQRQGIGLKKGEAMRVTTWSVLL